MTKISELAAANNLSGYETVGLVQGGRNVQSRSLPISGLMAQKFVQLGYEARADNATPAIAIGTYSESAVGYAIAIGQRSLASYAGVAVGSHAWSLTNGIAMGTYSYSPDPGGVALGQYVGSTGLYAIAIGCYVAAGTRSISVGYNVRTQQSDASIAIGVKASTFNIEHGSDHGIAIGYRSYVNGPRATAIGYSAYGHDYSVAIGMWADDHVTNSHNVSIGARSYSSFGYCTAIGTHASNYLDYHATAVGGYTYTFGNFASALGIGTRAMSAFSTAIGSGSAAHNSYSTVIGSESGSYNVASMVFGAGLGDHTAGSLAIGGCQTSPLRPAQHFKKFVGQTTAPVNASVVFTVGSSQITVIGPPGANGAAFSIIANPTPTDHVSANAGSDLTILLASDGEGIPIDAANSLSDIAAVFPFEGFTFNFTGPDIALNTPFFTNFGGGSDGSECVLTADGGAPFGSTTVELPVNSVGRLSGRVMAATPALFDDMGEAAAFSLAPLTIYRQNTGVFTFLAEPTFTMENNTAGASTWPVPTLSNDNGLLVITVNNSDASLLNWMAHVTIESNN